MPVSYLSGFKIFTYSPCTNDAPLGQERPALAGSRNEGDHAETSYSRDAPMATLAHALLTALKDHGATGILETVPVMVTKASLAPEFSSGRKMSPGFIYALLTFLLVSLSWVFFRSPTFAGACSRSVECGAISQCSKRRHRRRRHAAKVGEWRSQEKRLCN